MFSVEVVWFFGFHSHRMLSGACVCVSVRLQEKSDRDSKGFLSFSQQTHLPEHTQRDIDTAKKRAHPHTCHMPTPTKRQPKAKTGGRLLGEVSFRILWTSLDIFGLGLPAGPGRRCQRHKKPSPWPCSPPVKPTFW